MPCCRLRSHFAGLTFRALLANALFTCVVLVLASPCLAEDEELLPVPDAEEQQEARELIREVYEDDYAAATTDELKMELAAQLVSEGQKTHGDPTGRYVLIVMAGELAAETGNLRIAYQGLDILGREFDFDPFAAKADLAIAQLNNYRRPGDRPQCDQAAIPVRVAIEQAVNACKFNVAIELNQAYIDAARRTRSRSLVPAVARMREIEGLAERFAAVEDAFALLEEDPADEDANTTVGKFQCFVLENWLEGLPMLADGSDEELESLAVSELNFVNGPDEKKAMGDDWWNYSEEVEDQDMKNAIRRRVASWYLRARPGLTGLSLARVEQRLEEILPLLPEIRSQSFDSEANAEDAGWEGSGNQANGQAFGFSNSDESGGASPAGEAGGDFRRDGNPCYYADTHLCRDLTLDDDFGAAGEFDFTTESFYNDIRIGHLNTVPGRDQFSSIGFVLKKREISYNNTVCSVFARIYLDDGQVIESEDFFDAQPNSDVTWRYVWNSSDNTLSVEFFSNQGASLGTMGIRLNDRQRGIGATFNAFGISAGSVGRVYQSERGSSVGVYIDGVEYTAK